MTYVQPMLHVAPSPAEAKRLGDERSRQAWDAADASWRLAARLVVIAMPEGTWFLAEDVVCDVNERGFRTRNAKAIGHVLKSLAKAGLIRRTDEVRRARTSHGSYKPVWERT